MNVIKSDVLIIGSGIAGLYAAKILSQQRSVTVVTKGAIRNSNSILAQGGIAASIDKYDDWEYHLADTLTAGVNHNVESTTMAMVKDAPKIIEQLADIGVPFDKEENKKLALGQEGGHRRRRIVHAGGDSTGYLVIEKLIQHIQGAIDIYENETAIDLIFNSQRCVGVITKNKSGEKKIFQAPHVIMATGGVGGLYPITSNDSTVTGDGIAMAYRAGAKLVDLEFVQFHPTMLHENGITYGLISEAVRGEGAKLIDEAGNHIMKGIHPLEELAPRDIVARRIFDVLQMGHQVFLDISMISNFKVRFPTISIMCEENNISIAKGLLPVFPGAHFIMGGIKIDIHGETSIKGLYAIGEVAYTGVHGANRLASNSLLEGVVFANRLANYILNQPMTSVTSHLPRYIKNPITFPSKEEIRHMMMNHVGIIRNSLDLKIASDWFLKYIPKQSTNTLLDLTIDEQTRLNMLTVGWLISSSALIRTESRGGHYRSDYPTTNNDHWLKRYIVRRRETNEFNKAKNVVTTAIS